jgi:hypothetical protein|tara:strand:- start:455 stop:559 length:105 start_codon:yes stop_codon:yes gene_type:complete
MKILLIGIGFIVASVVMVALIGVLIVYIMKWMNK